ncbi:MFS transporter [Streptomyces sp. AJS327]|uniref:MFS transporter n=1 Tax=Streptomyces sp. AJS327 TaxID=2545265 RepID=UPI0021551496|nr:MFS transporter [Streptomyces sp. AJS327]
MNLPPGMSPVVLLRSTFSGVSTGLYLTGSAVFFTEYIGLSPRLVGLGISIAWLISTATMMPFGMLADRFGGRRIWLIGTSASALVFCLYPLAHAYWQFQLIIALELLVSGLGSAGSGRYFGDLFPEGHRARGRAYLRVTSNIGMAVGAAIAGVAISLDSRPGYLAIVLIAAGVTALDAILIAWAVPHVDRPHQRVEGEARRKPVAIRDRSFVALAVLNGVFNLNGPMLSVLLPLWILSRTDAPSWLVAGTMLMNMALCIVFQIPASRGVESPGNGARAWMWAGVALVVSSVGFAASGTTHGVATLVALAVGLAALTAGELLTSAGTWAIRYGLAPESRRGEYTAVFGLGGQLSWIAGPAALSFLVMSGGAAGWLVLAGVFVAAAVAARPLVVWAERTDREDGEFAAAVPAARSARRRFGRARGRAGGE